MAVRSEAALLLVQAIRHIAQPLDADAPDYDAVLEHIGDARLVLLGEATHGTHEFYQERARITERLIVEHGFTAVALEADWPDAYRVNRYVRGEGADRDAEESLRDFRRFPSWMWRNAAFLDFTGWLRDYNVAAPDQQRAGVYGLDLYNLFASIEEASPDRDRTSSWNLRERHMVETLDALMQDLSGRRPNPKVVVWAHNSHLGNAGATEMGRRGELNVGQLVRTRFGASARLIGFTTHDGTVTAASEWGGQAELQQVRPSLPGSIEQVLHETEIPRFFLDLRGHRRSLDGFQHSYLERAIGVIYRPETERMSHYFETRLLDQFDSVIHIDRTRGVEPLQAPSTPYLGSTGW
ncbi:MAG TPA: erythromycin esterase family protein [Vicinamibacterales bacterium]|nr:erythromycin esterase family protein [Vicinamibacterales bacterium]